MGFGFRFGFQIPKTIIFFSFSSQQHTVTAQVWPCVDFALYAASKYWGHRKIPGNLLREQIDREFSEAREAKRFKTEAKSFTKGYAIASDEPLAAPVALPPPPDLLPDFGDAIFIASNAFEKKRPDYVFKRKCSEENPGGAMGYYRDEYIVWMNS